MRFVLVLVILLLASSPPARPDNATIPGQLFQDPPTFRCLAFRWLISGDENANATVVVSYRKAGDATWRGALPMLRVHREITDRAGTPYTAGNLFAGSLLNLTPGTEYEVRFLLSDPDGASSERNLKARTRSESTGSPHGRTLIVRSDDDPRLKSNKDFHTLVEAVKMAGPGDKLYIARGTYHGPIVIPRSGEPGAPICFWAEPGAVLEGSSPEANVIDASGKNHLWFSGLTIRNGRTGIKAHGCKDLCIQNCRIEDVNNGILNYSAESADWLIDNNDITGRVKNWYPRVESSDTGINCCGSGMVVRHNRVRRFWDGISTDNVKVKPEWADAPHPPQVSIDIYANDISEALDDGIEADYCLYNVRVFENRVMNVHTGISTQPNLGGPLYIFRNVVYNTTNTPLKLHNYSTGLAIYNNTLIGAGQAFQSYPPAWQNAILRNNLFLGTRGYAVETGSPDSKCDYNGYRRTPGMEQLIKWSADGGKTWGRYYGLKDFTKATGYEEHGIMIDYDQFERATPPKEGGTYPPSDLDLRLRAGSAAIDAGIRIPTINDDFRGKAPDIGAIEAGLPPPQYGPVTVKP